MNSKITIVFLLLLVLFRLKGPLIVSAIQGSGGGGGTVEGSGSGSGSSSSSSSGDCIEDDIAYAGNDLHTVKNVTSYQDCRTQCINYNGCTHWTWVRAEMAGGMLNCNLKNSDSGSKDKIGKTSGPRDCILAPCAEDNCDRNETLQIGSNLTSSNGRYFAKMQSDGNFVIYCKNNSLWSTHTNGTSVKNGLEFQSDGNLVISSTTKELWNSETNNTDAHKLIMQDDGDLVLYDEKRENVYWRSDTRGTCPEECLELDTGYPGNDVGGTRQNVQSWQDCRNLCFNFPKCSHWSWASKQAHRSVHLNCYMKKKKSPSQKSQGRISGSQYCGLGYWGSWSNWNTCTAICGTNGTQTRTRTCNGAVISGRAPDCIGNGIETKVCTSCTINGIWDVEYNTSSSYKQSNVYDISKPDNTVTVLNLDNRISSLSRSDDQVHFPTVAGWFKLVDIIGRGSWEYIRLRIDDGTLELHQFCLHSFCKSRYGGLANYYGAGIGIKRDPSSGGAPSPSPSSSITTSPSPTRSPAPCKGHTCIRNETLLIGSQLTSSNGRYSAKMQSDGNFVIYCKDFSLWSTRTSGKTVKNGLEFQSDSNLMISSINKELWNSETNNTDAHKLIMQNDGDLVLYDEKMENVYWRSDTRGTCPEKRESPKVVQTSRVGVSMGVGSYIACGIFHQSSSEDLNSCYTSCLGHEKCRSFGYSGMTRKCYLTSRVIEHNCRIIKEDSFMNFEVY